jgi:hypothetical protein
MRASGRAARAVMAQLRGSLSYPGETVIVRAAGGNAAFARKFREVPHARIF